MNTLDAFTRGWVSRGRESMVFDWNKAARIIVEGNIQNAGAGLSGDWEWTGGEILRDGEIVPADDTYTYLSSRWASPELEIDGGKIIDCYIMQSESDGWDSSTYWPESARKILEGKE